MCVCALCAVCCHLVRVCVLCVVCVHVSSVVCSLSFLSGICVFDMLLLLLLGFVLLSLCVSVYVSSCFFMCRSSSSTLMMMACC